MPPGADTRKDIDNYPYNSGHGTKPHYIVIKKRCHCSPKYNKTNTQ